MTWYPESEYDPKGYAVQCKLIRHSKTGTIETTSWIPEKFAVVGTIVKLKQGNNWEDGWIVKIIYGKKSYKFILDHENDFKKTRKASDI